MQRRFDAKLVVAVVAVLVTVALGFGAQAATKSALPWDTIAVAAPLSWEASPERGADWQRLEAEGRIQFDAQTGNYRISYTTPSGENKTWVFEPANRLQVEVKAEVVYDPATYVYTYTYTVRNDPESIQAMCKFSVSHPHAEVWNASAIPDDPKVDGGWHFSPTALKQDLASWGYTEGGGPGVPPGEIAVFSFQSDIGPGTVYCYATGYVPTPSFLDHEAPLDPRPLFVGQSAQGVTVGPAAYKAASGATGYVCLRPLLSSLGWSLTWDSQAKRVLASQNDRRLSVAAGSSDIVLNGIRLSVGKPAKVMGSRIRVSAEVINYVDPVLASQRNVDQGTA